MEATLLGATWHAGPVASGVWAVDLDGTLVRTDTLWESVVTAAIRHPLQFLTIVLTTIFSAHRSRQDFKQRIAAIALPDPATLPYREDLLRLVRQHRACGGQLHLVTAAHQTIADAVAAHLGLFESVAGSTARTNMKGAVKAAFLVERFPEGFTYIGDSRADLPVWRKAQAALLVGGASRFAESVEAAGTPILASLPKRPIQLLDYGKLLRTHQWVKNLLIFVPLFLSHAWGRPEPLLRVAEAFTAFSMVASSTYIFNDLADLASDRRHPTKCNRPVACGDIPIVHAMAIALALLLAGVTATALLSSTFALCVSAYVVLTILYSAGFKRVPLIDVAFIGGLFALRVVMGIFVAQVPYSDWLVSFSILFFCSLAFAKRHTELIKASAANLTWVPGRGYRANEWPLTLAFGVSMAIASLIVMLLYIRLEALRTGLYTKPGWLIVAPLGTLCWIMRLWLVSHRGELDDDPIVFALRDRVSWGLAAAIVVGILLAT